MRRIGVLVEHLPPDSACAALARNGAPDWSIEAHLLDDLRIALTSTKEQKAPPHPLRPKPRRRIDRRKLDAARRRRDERLRRLQQEG